MKILSPAGNLESLKVAVYNGADEVYLGIDEFNARNIKSFTIDSLKEAVDFAHIYGVRVFLAINILFSDEEFENAVKTLLDAYALGVDAFIVQDIALASYVHENYPQIEIHASTQMGIHNLEGVKQIEKFGFKRVVLARETPLEEIKRIRQNSDIEIEYFVQGALCVSFSGNCYLSSYLFNASGNRGKCKQLCRLPYSLKLDGKTIKKGYLLSAKDFNMSSRLADLEKAGVTSLKIEGRARRPYYVATVTKEYYNALHGKTAREKELELAFTRGYTEGYFNGNENIISDIQSHVGIAVGRVEKVVNGKRFNQVYFTSSMDISPKSVLKFFDGKKETNTLTAYDLNKTKNGYVTTTTQKVKEGLFVRLISDYQKEEDALKVTKKRPLILTLAFGVDKLPFAKVEIQGRSLFIEGETVCQSAKGRPLTELEITENFEKSDYFAPRLTIEKLDEVFMPKSALNAFRRGVYDAVVNALTGGARGVVEYKTPTKPNSVERLKDFVITDQIEGTWKEKNVIYSPEEYDLESVAKFTQNCSSQGKSCYLDTPNFALEKDIKLLKEIIETTNVGVVANNYYALGLSDNLVIGTGLNVYNEKSAKVFDKPFITAESQIATRVDAPYMTLRHCPIKEHVGGNCSNCKYQQGYEYVLENGKALKLKRKKLSSCTFYLTK